MIVESCRGGKREFPQCRSTMIMREFPQDFPQFSRVSSSRAEEVEWGRDGWIGSRKVEGRRPHLSCVSVCRAKVLAISKDERSLPRQLPVQRVAPSGARPGDRRVQVHWVKPSVREDGTVANRRAVTTVNP